MDELGKLIKNARERRGYTTQLAGSEALGISNNRLHRLENGVTKEFPLPEVIHRIAEVFGVSVEDMLITAGYLDPPSGDDGGLTVEDRAFLDGLAHYLPALAEDERRHLIETARLFAEAAARRAPTPGASHQAAPESPAARPDRSSGASSGNGRRIPGT